MRRTQHLHYSGAIVKGWNFKIHSQDNSFIFRLFFFNLVLCSYDVFHEFVVRGTLAFLNRSSKSLYVFRCVDITLQIIGTDAGDYLSLRKTSAGLLFDADSQNNYLRQSVTKPNLIKPVIVASCDAIVCTTRLL